MDNKTYVVNQSDYVKPVAISPNAQPNIYSMLILAEKAMKKAGINRETFTELKERLDNLDGEYNDAITLIEEYVVLVGVKREEG